MQQLHGNTLSKAERLCSKIAIDRLFSGENRSMAAFPIRAVYRTEKAETTSDISIKILISVSKKRFHHAVKRNRIKRQIRDAYRIHKQLLWNTAQEKGLSLSIAFIWLDTQLHDTADVEAKIKNLLHRIVERVA